MAAEIAARGPLAVREAKRLTDAAATYLDAGLAAELTPGALFASEDMVEGADASSPSAN